MTSAQSRQQQSVCEARPLALTALCNDTQKQVMYTWAAEKENLGLWDWLLLTLACTPSRPVTKNGSALVCLSSPSPALLSLAGGAFFPVLFLTLLDGSTPHTQLSLARCTFHMQANGYIDSKYGFTADRLYNTKSHFDFEEFGQRVMEHKLET